MRPRSVYLVTWISRFLFLGGGGVGGELVKSGTKSGGLQAYA